MILSTDAKSGTGIVVMRWIVPVVVMGVLVSCAGCPGRVRYRPGPAFIEARSAEVSPFSSRRQLETDFDSLPLSPRHRTHPEVGSLKGHGSLSIGSSTSGFVYNCRELPAEGTHHRVMAQQAGRRTTCAVDELVEAVLKAAAEVDRKFPGSTLPVGNLSRIGGGALKWSVSHRAGRDVDFGFYLKDSGGRQVFQNSMGNISRDGLTLLEDGTVASYDTARNWAMIRSLLTDRNISIQWIFMADHLHRRLLEYARKHREPAGIIALADQVIAQPRGLKHDDHVHLRIYCSKDDLLEGCRDMGSNRPWYSPPGPRLEKRYQELVRLARSKDPAVRRDAVEVLGHFGDSRAASLLAKSLDDLDPAVSRAAVDAIMWLGIAGIERMVVDKITAPGTPDWLVDRLIAVLVAHTAREQRALLWVRLLGVERELTLSNGVFSTTYVVADRALQAILRYPSAAATRILGGAISGRGRISESATARISRALEGINESVQPIRRWTGDGI